MEFSSVAKEATYHVLLTCWSLFLNNFDNSIFYCSIRHGYISIQTSNGVQVSQGHDMEDSGMHPESGGAWNNIAGNLLMAAQ